MSHSSPNAELWDEFHPALQHLTVTLRSPERDTREVTFGLRDISTDGTQFLINGRKTFIRGTLECCVFPKTGHPPTDIKDWERIIRVAKSCGLNLFRFHSYCPPEAAFEAADNWDSITRLRPVGRTNPPRLATANRLMHGFIARRTVFCAPTETIRRLFLCRTAMSRRRGCTARKKRRLRLSGRLQWLFHRIRQPLQSD